MGKNKVEDPMNAKTEIVRLISNCLEQKEFTNRGLFMWPKTNLVIPQEENGISKQAKQIPRFQLAHRGACYT